MNGHKNENSNNQRRIGIFCGKCGWDEIEGSPTEEGYGKGGNMCVQFYRKM